jgi:hypothetical protein
MNFEIFFNLFLTWIGLILASNIFGWIVALFEEGNELSNWKNWRFYNFLQHATIGLIYVSPFIGFFIGILFQELFGFGLISVITGFIFFPLAEFLEKNDTKKNKIDFYFDNKVIIQKIFDQNKKLKLDYDFYISDVQEVKDGDFIHLFWVAKDSLIHLYDDSYYTLMIDGFISKNYKLKGSDVVFKSKAIKISDIEVYYLEGEVNYKTFQSGGGFNLKGAIIGGVIAGGIGAIIGSRKETTINSVTVDKREVNLIYKSESKVIKEKFPYEFIDAFNQLIPEKDYHLIIASKK